EAIRLTTLAVDQLRWRDGLGLLGVALGYQANALAKAGRLDDARRVLDAMTPHQRTGRHAYIQVAEAHAWIHIHEGRLDDAERTIAEAVATATERGAVFLAALACC